MPAVGLLVGAALGFGRTAMPAWIARSLLVASAVVAVWAWRRQSTVAFGALVAWTFCLGGIVLASSAWQRAWQPPLLADVGPLDAGHDRSPLVVTGRLRADASPTASGVSLSLDVLEIEHPGQPPRGPGADGRGASLGGVALTVVGDLARERMGEWRAGRIVRAPTELRRPSVYRDPGVPDHERELAARGTRLVGTVKSGALVDVIARGTPIQEALSAARAYCRRAIAGAVGRWSTRSAAIVSAIVIGDRSGLDAETEQRLQDAGTYHVMAISGAHVALLAGALVGLFRLAGLYGRASMGAAALGLIAYAGLVGGGASVERATVMAVLYLGGRAIDQRGPPLNTLACAAATLTLASPLDVSDPAFILTCGATLAILLIVPAADALRSGRLTKVVVGTLAASLATEGMLLPVSARVFSRVTFAGLALNFLAIPLMAVVQAAGMSAVLVWSASRRAAGAIGWLAHLGAEGLVRSADLVRLAPWLSLRIAPPSPWVIALYYAAGGTAWALWRRGSRGGRRMVAAARRVCRLAVALAAGAGIWIVAEPWAWPLAHGDGRLHVTFVDVGQGDAALLRLPRGSTMTVDAGGVVGASTFDVGDRVVAPVLREAGVRRLDEVVLTHGDADHIGGAPALVREFRPRAVWEGVPVPPVVALTEVRAEAVRARSQWANVQAGDWLTIDGVAVVVWHPPLPDWERQRVRNDDSVVLELRWRDVSIVLTGDIEHEAEAALVGRIPPAPIRIVKVPHHGSLTSSTPAFVHMLDPDVAVISVGRDNPFGHPAPAIVARYLQSGALVFRTDVDGAITLETDGRRATVTTFAGRRFDVR